MPFQAPLVIGQDPGMLTHPNTNRIAGPDRTVSEGTVEAFRKGLGNIFNTRPEKIYSDSKKRRKRVSLFKMIWITHSFFSPLF
jgi:hypothetical protein